MESCRTGEGKSQSRPHRSRLGTKQPTLMSRREWAHGSKQPVAPVPHGREKIHEELKGHMVYFCCSIRVYTGSQLCSTWRFRTGPASRVLQAPDIGAAPKFPQSPEVPGRSLHGSRVCGAAPLALRTSAPPPNIPGLSSTARSLVDRAMCSPLRTQPRVCRSYIDPARSKSAIGKHVWGVEDTKNRRGSQRRARVAVPPSTRWARAGLRGKPTAAESARKIVQDA